VRKSLGNGHRNSLQGYLDHRLNNRRVVVWLLAWARDFSKKYSDRLWGSPNALFDGYRGLLPLRTASFAEVGSNLTNE